MLNPKSLLRLFSLGLLLVGTEPLIAQTKTDDTNTHHSITQVSFKPPRDDGKPKTTVGSGSRSGEGCSQDTIQVSSVDRPTFLALVPPNNYGLTVAERPTFFIALPKTSAKQIVLSIRENGTRHHSQIFVPIEASGIISIKLPEDLPPLEVDKNYQWTIVLVCGEKPGPDDPAIVSWVRRVNPPQPIPAQFQRENALTQAIWYGEQGLWYDTLTALVKAKRSQPDSQVMSDIWTNFLQSVGLQEAISEPLQF